MTHSQKERNMSARETVKIMLLKRCMTITKLADRMTEFTGHKYTRQAISSRLSRNSLRYDEVEIIADILGFKISIEEK